MNKRQILGALAALTAGAFGAALPAHGADEPWPSRPIRVIAPIPPGGTSDVIAREFAQGMAARVGGTAIVDNRPGADGLIATQAVARAAPDGYTLLFTLTQHIQVPLQYKNLGYDPINDFVPLARIGAAATVVVARSSLGIKSTGDLQKLAATRQLTFATTATGPQVIMEVFNKSAKLGMLNVPYKGEPPVLTDLLGGQIDLALLTVATARQYVNNGQLAPLAVIAANRAAALPNTPTFLEAGYKEVNWTGGWYGFLAPAKTPPAIVTRLVAAFKGSIEDPAIRNKMIGMDINLNWLDGPAFAPVMKQDMDNWAALVKRSGVVIEQR